MSFSRSSAFGSSRRTRRALGAGVAMTAAFVACSYSSEPDFGGGAAGDGGPGSSNGQAPLPDAAPGIRPVPGNAPDHCRDGQKSADESDVDCGGADCVPCAPGTTCGRNEDCFSRSCVDGRCAAYDLADGIWNGAESDVDCGGEVYAPRCANGQRCRRAVDCQSRSCVERVCAAPVATDGVKNGDETDVDCGGPLAETPRCEIGAVCVVNLDCASLWCHPDAKRCTTAQGANGARDGGESDIDCGGADPQVVRCGVTKRCDGPADCADGVCSAANLCQRGTGVDGVQNGSESDVDCGGNDTGAGPCEAGKKCNDGADCVGSCGVDGVCTDLRSCVGTHGVVTCGAGETEADGGSSGEQESCCAEAELPSGAKVDKYLITAGRMRAMIDALEGNVRQFVAQNAPADWDYAWTEQLPATRADADFQLGPWAYSEGCHLRYGGARSYDTDTRFVYGNGVVDESVLPREVLDEKALNCAPRPLMAALCLFDGKRLATRAALDELRTWQGTRTFPWGNQAPDATRMNHDFGAGYAYTVPAGATELSAHVSPPGRFAAGNSPNGHADVVGLLWPWVELPDTPVLSSWSWTTDEGDGEPIASFANGSYVFGARCMR